MSLFLLTEKFVCKTRILLVFAFLVTSAGVINAQSNMVNLVLSVKKANYSKVEKAIRNAGGRVNFTHKYVEGMAVTVPEKQVPKIFGLPEVLASEKDLMVTIPEPRRVRHDGFEMRASDLQVQAQNQTPLDEKSLKKLIETYPNNYYPYTNVLTKTEQFYKSFQHYGEGVIVAVIDAGISKSAAAVAGNIIGGEDLTGDGYGPFSSLNGGHGTWVACCIGANLIVGFGNPAIQNAIKMYAPNSVIPNNFGPGIDGIPLLGQAPLAQFYALKVFPYNSNSSPRSRIALALERAIELKENYNSGIAGGVNIRIVNMSLGGAGLTAGNDDIYAPLIKRAHDAGILMVISAGNSGPSGMTIGEPGASPNVVTCGAVNDATHERIIMEYIYSPSYGPGIGGIYRPLNNNVISDYSSRGPNADGRPDPDITAPGDYRFVQSPNGSFSWVSGTSFSAPTVAGAAALLLSARPQSTPDQLRAALLNGADKSSLSGYPTMNEQGFGFLNVLNAYGKLTSGVTNPPDRGISNPLVSINVALQDQINIISGSSYSGTTGSLAPGQRAEFYFNIPKLAKSVKVILSSVVAQLPRSAQNQLFGDDILFAIHSGEFTTGDYRGGTPVFVKSGQLRSYTLTGLDLDIGIMKVTVMGDWTNKGRISANVFIQADYGVDFKPMFSGYLAQGQGAIYSLNVPAGTESMDLRLKWISGWDRYPTNDLDMAVYDPSGKLVNIDNDGDGVPDGMTLSMPECLTIINPVPGSWTLQVLGYTIWRYKENYTLYADMHRGFRKESVALTNDAVPTEFALSQNWPNPFNPTTTISYDLPQDAVTTLRIYNSLGQLVRTLVNESKPAGSHSVMFDGKDDAGVQLSSGMYIYQITAGSFTKSVKMMLLK